MPITVHDQKTGVTHNFPDDFTDADISAALAQEDTAAPSAPRPSSTLTKGASLLPLALGTAGGVLGKAPVIGAGLSYLGGAGGEGYRQAIEAGRRLAGGAPEGDLPASLMDSLSAMNTAGATQAAGDVMGRGIGKAVLEPLAGGFMRAAAGTKSILKEFPDLIPTMLRERLPVGRLFPGTTTGSAQAAARRKVSGATTDEILKDAERAGLEIDPRAVTGAVQQRATHLGDAPIGKPSQISLDNLTQQFLSEHPSPISPVEAKSMKQLAQTEGEAVLKAEREGHFVPTSARLKGQFNRDIAGELRSALENMGTRGGRQFGREVGVSESRTQGLIGAGKAIEEAETRPLTLNPFELRNLAALGIGGAGAAYEGNPWRMPEYILAARAMGSPKVLSRLALAASHPVTQALMGRGTISLGQLLSSHQDQR